MFKITWREEVVKIADFLGSPSVFDSLGFGWGPSGNQVFNKDYLVILMQVVIIEIIVDRQVSSDINWKKAQHAFITHITLLI